MGNNCNDKTARTAGAAGAAGAVRSFLADERGATAIEYGLIAALIFLAIVAAIDAYSTSASDMYERISSEMDAAGN